MMLAGDDELAAVLAEMGGAKTKALANTHTIANKGKDKDKDKDKSNLQACTDTDSRLKNSSPSIMEWPEHFCLRESLEPGVCKGWTGTAQYSSSNSNESQNNKHKCLSCSLGRAFHRLSISTESKKSTKKSSPVLLLQLLFCHTRNIRCLASENIQCQPNNNYYETISQEIHMLLQSQHQQQEEQQLLSPMDLEVIREKASELHSIVTKQRHSSSKEWRLWVILKADRLYYRIYYAALTSSSPTTISIPDPPLYFSFPGLAWKVSTREAKHLCQLLEPTVQQILLDTMGLDVNLDSNWDNDDKDNGNGNGNDNSVTAPFTNPLHTLWQHRFYEMVRHFHVMTPESHDETSTTTSTSTSTSTTTQQTPSKRITENLLDQATSRPGNMHPQFAKHETMAPSKLLAEWRDVARDFPASLYAYATPSPKVLQTLQSLLLLDNHNITKVIEVGAGTGYWAALLQQQCGIINLEPYDVSPPGTFSDNEYHGEVPAFTVIQKLDASVAADNNNNDDKTALFLCYPPPGTDMALSALQSFAGNMVVHVGEWAGLTGDTAFEACLMEQFVCQRHVPIPIWGTDAAYLTVWTRRKRSTTRTTTMQIEKDIGNGCISSAIGGCMACQEKWAVKRCKFARMLQYCSQTCCEIHKTERKSWLLVHMLDLGNGDVSWNNPRHFMDLSLSSITRTRSINTNDDDNDFVVGGKKKRQRQKNRRKKRRRSK